MVEKTLFVSLCLLLSSGVLALDSDCMGVDSNDETLSEPVTPEIQSILNDGERDFSVHLIKTLFQEFESIGQVNKNIFVSPASIYQTLMLAYMGARGVTEEELAMTLGFKDKVNRTEVMKNYLFERVFQSLRARNPDLGYKLTHANKFYFDRSLDLSQCLQLVLRDELEAVDFNKPEKARGIINDWVKGKTEGKIRNFLPPDSLSGSKVALVNAAYFKGNWASKFNDTETKKDIFYVRRDKNRMTEFMTQKGKFNYYTSEELRAHVLEMPYEGGEEMSMIVILPPFEKDSLIKTVANLTPKTLKGVMNEVKSGFYQVDDLTVTIPKFRIEQSLELSSTIGDLGVPSLFQDSDLSGFLSPNAENQNEITLQSALHKSFIEVNEEGSEAAAATALFGFRSARPLFHTHFVANHPFLFLIYDKPADTIMFFGIYQDPKM